MHSAPATEFASTPNVLTRVSTMINVRVLESAPIRVDVSKANSAKETLIVMGHGFATVHNVL